MKLNLPNDVKQIDAVFKWKKNNKVYLFYGEKYWRFDDQAKSMDGGYPLVTGTRWRGMPRGRILSAYSSKRADDTFFIMDNKFYRFDD